MKTKILELQLIGKRIKLVYGTPFEASMVRESTKDPEHEDDMIKYGGGLVEIMNPELDPDKLDFFIWINSGNYDYFRYSPISYLVEGVLEFVDRSVIQTLLRDKDSLPEDVEVYIKGQLFKLGLDFLEEEISIPKLNRKKDHFIKGIINGRNLYIIRFVDNKMVTSGRLIWDLSNRDVYEIHLKNDKSDTEILKYLLQEIICLSKKRFPEATGELNIELTSHLFRLIFNTIKIK